MEDDLSLGCPNLFKFLSISPFPGEGPNYFLLKFHEFKNQGEDPTSYKFTIDSGETNHKVILMTREKFINVIQEWLMFVKCLFKMVVFLIKEEGKEEVSRRERRRQRLMAKIVMLERNYFTEGGA